MKFAYSTGIGHFEYKIPDVIWEELITCKNWSYGEVIHIGQDIPMTNLYRCRWIGSDNHTDNYKFGMDNPYRVEEGDIRERIYKKELNWRTDVDLIRLLEKYKSKGIKIIEMLDSAEPVIITHEEGSETVIDRRYIYNE